MRKFEEPEALSSVAAFHDTFDLPVETKPVIPTQERCQLRINLIEEELAELKAAIGEGDLTGVADAFADLQYVLSGAILEFGLGDRFKALFDEVQRSNMSKVCKSREEAEETLTYYRRERNMDGEIVAKGDTFIVYRKPDGKVLKSVQYSEAMLENFIK